MFPGRKGSHARVYIPTQLCCRAAHPERGSVESFLPLLLLKCQPLMLQSQMADSMAPSLMMRSLSFCGPDPQLGQIIAAPWVSLQQCEITAADSSCWGSSRYQTKSPMKTLAHGDGCQKFRWTAVDPKANLGCDVIAHHCATEPVL